MPIFCFFIINTWNFDIHFTWFLWFCWFIIHCITRYHIFKRFSNLNRFFKSSAETQQYFWLCLSRFDNFSSIAIWNSSEFCFIILCIYLIILHKTNGFFSCSLICSAMKWREAGLCLLLSYKFIFFQIFLVYL